MDCHAPVVQPLTPEGPRPLWSVMIPTHNDRGFLRHALQSVLDQDPGAAVMQIEVIDDHSTEVDVPALVRALSQDRVQVRRQESNVGVGSNFNSCIDRARGELVHILHDDDVTFPGFYRTFQGFFQSHPAAGAAFCRVENIDEQGKPQGPNPQVLPDAGLIPDWKPVLLAGCPVLFPGMVVRRAAYETVGGFVPEHHNTADWIMWVRIAKLFPIGYLPSILAGYRRHARSDSGQSVREARETKYLANALRVFEEILPQTAETVALIRQGQERMALYGLGRAQEAFRRGDFFAGLNQTREALRCSQGLRVIRRIESGLLKGLDQYESRVAQLVRDVREGRNTVENVSTLRLIRLQLAQNWLEAGPETVQQLLNDVPGKLQSHIYSSPVRWLAWTDEEQAFCARLRDDFTSGFGDPCGVNRWLAGMLYMGPHQLPHALDITKLPGKLLLAYLSWQNQRLPAPQAEEQHAHRRHLQIWVEYLGQQMEVHGHESFWQKVARIMLEQGWFIPELFAGSRWVRVIKNAASGEPRD